MKILQLGKFYPPDIGGIETAIYNITEELNKRGIKCDVLCSNSKKEYKEETISKKSYEYKVYRTKSYGKIFSTSITPQMIFKLKEISSNYDIIHVHHPDPMANLALFLANLKKQKIVVHWHSDIIRQKLAIKFYKPLLNWMLKRADVIIGTSPNYIEGSEQLKNFKSKCKVVPLGIKKGILKVDEKKLKELKTKYLNKKIVFSLGRFIYYKGFEYLIEAGKYLPENYTILIGGGGPLKNKYESLIKGYNLTNKVYLAGKIPQSHLGSYYMACDVFCLPSIEKSEAFGLVLVEAMSFGKPIVATQINGSGVPWVNQNGITGINVKPKDPKALAEAIRSVCENSEIYQKFSKNALERFKEVFTIEKVVDRLVGIYKSLLNQKPKK